MNVARPTRLLLVALFAVLPFVLTGCFGWNSAPAPSSRVAISGQVKVPNGTSAQSAGFSSQQLVSGGTGLSGAKVMAYSFQTGQPIPPGNPATATTEPDGSYTLRGIPANAGMVYIVVISKDQSVRLATMVEVKPSGSGASAGTSPAQFTADINATTTLATAAWTPKFGKNIIVTAGDVSSSFAAADNYVQSHSTINLSIGGGILTSDGTLASTAPSDLTNALTKTVPAKIYPDVSAAKSVMAQLRSMVTVSGVQDSRWAAFSPLMADLAVLQTNEDIKRIGTRVSLVSNVRENVQYGYIDPMSHKVFTCSGDSYNSHFAASGTTTADFAIVPCSDSGLSGPLEVDYNDDGTNQSLAFSSTADKDLHYDTSWTKGEAAIHPEAPNGELHASFKDAELPGTVKYDGSAQTDGDKITLNIDSLVSPVINITNAKVIQTNTKVKEGAFTVYTGSITGGTVTLTTDHIGATISGGLEATWLVDSGGAVRSVKDFALHSASLVDNRSSITSSKNTWTINSLTAHVQNYTSVDFRSSSSPAALVIADVDASFKTVRDGTLNLKGHLDAGTPGVFKISGLSGGAQAVVTKSSNPVLKFSLNYNRNAPSASGTMVNGSGTKVADVVLNSDGPVPIPELDYTDDTIEFLA